ncbi:MAG: hypothetical protein R2825_23730 [Saprospiraceae bacterium]
MEMICKNLNKDRLLAISIGLVYLWFGALKFFPGLSPADALAKDTIHHLTFGLIPSDVSIILLAIMEVLIGACLVFCVQIKKTIVLALAHITMTFTPLLFFPELSFNSAPFTLTLVGQYIMKNIIIISALLMLYPVDKKTYTDPAVSV